MKLRLLLTDKCDRNCKLCVNKTIDFSSFPICQSYKDWKEISITGGEPLLFPSRIIEVVKEIREVNLTAKIWVYTADAGDPYLFSFIVEQADGITLTIHTKPDMVKFDMLYNHEMIQHISLGKSLRLVVFKGIISEDELKARYPRWDSKVITWKKDYPIPCGEILQIHPKAFLEY